MCWPVYYNCPYCELRRFFMWDECRSFWARYLYIVIDQSNFHLRPRLSGGPDEPPACGAGVLAPRNREFELGRCPRHGCPSRQAAVLRPQPQLVQHKMLRKPDGKMQPPPPPLMMRTGRHFKSNAEVDGGPRNEVRKEQFAARFFVKRPVRPLPRFDGADEEHGGDGFHHESRRERRSAAGDTEEPGLHGQTLRVPAPLDLLPGLSEDLSQSFGSTIIESGSEVDSCDWNETYQSLRGLKTRSV